MIDQPAPAAETQPATRKTMPVSKEALFAIATRIQADFADGFQWQDIVSTSRQACLFMKVFRSLSVEERIQGVQEIINNIVSLTDPSHRPNEFTDPLFKELSYACVDLLVGKYEGLRKAPDNNPSLKKPSPTEISAFRERVDTKFIEGFRWRDLFIVISSTVEFIEDYKELTIQEKRQLAMNIVDAVIDEVDALFLPDDYLDSIFKAISNAVIAELIV